MFGAISKLFKKSERPTPAPASQFSQPFPRGAGAALQNSTATTARSEPTVTPLPNPGSRRVSGEALSIPYSSIIKLVPQELWGKLAPAGVAGYNFSISRKIVMEQMPHGAVKVSFADLRRGAPSGVFVTGAAEDGRMIDLPLAEILAQLHPDAYARRPNQVRVQVSQDLPDLFGAKGERLANVRVLEKKAAKESNTTSVTRQKMPVVAPNAPVPPSLPSNITPLPAPQVTERSAGTVAPPPAPIPAPNLRISSASPAPPSPKLSQLTSSGSKPPSAAGSPLPRPLPKVASQKNANPPPASPSPSPVVSPPPPVPIAPIQTSPSMVAAANALGFGSLPFLVAVDQIASAWPSGVRQELAQLKIPEAKLGFPPVEICEGLKRGRIQYPWRTLRSWLQPTPFYATPSLHDDIVIELPLSTLTPLFLDFIRANTSDKTIASAAGITEFFRRAEAFAGTSAEPIRVVEPTTSISISSPPVSAVGAGAAEPAPAPDVKPDESLEKTPTPGVAAIEHGKLCLPVNHISQSWPEPILRDIQQFALSNSRFEMPLDYLESSLKSGRVEFLWKELCAWLNPASRAAQVSIHGEVRLPLPLNIVGPLFLKQRDVSGATKKRVTVAESIPDVFSAAGKPVVASSVAAIQTPEPEMPRPATGPAGPETVPVPEPALRKMPTTVSELFGEKEKKSWTPNEIVHRTVTLPNVAGSLIAMQDGLLVAHCMPPTMKTETVAAFVPQIFGRLNQYCKELQLGDARSISFTVESGTVQVFNAGIIYFAALSKPGALLPLPELQLIASELSRHTK
jgi:predicted regulator of Ras-like GTPase activity (Roadblock/LC7/MglB family)